MVKLSRRRWIQAASAIGGAAAVGSLPSPSYQLLAADSRTDSLPMQLYKSLSDEQIEKVCLPVDHPKRQYINNWWYIHPEFRIPSTFDPEQQRLIQTIFDSLHSKEYIDDVKKQVKIDQYGKASNAPAVAFFGTPENMDFEFLFTGHHVTRRCNAHSDIGQGFGGAPIFYGHYPHPESDMRTNFHEPPEHPGNPYWYQGRVFNQFVKSLDGTQQQQGLVSGSPRSERSNKVIEKIRPTQGLRCADLTPDQKQQFIDTMKSMMAMFRSSDVEATIKSIVSRDLVDQLHVSWFDGKFDIGSDMVWDTWQIEGPNMVWYFRGQPHIHSYFHLSV